MPTDDFARVFRRLKAILKPYARQLQVVTDTEREFYLDTRHVMKNKKRLFFGAVRIGKSYVSFQLMPVYVFPDLLNGISPRLRLRMQGKSCFNFKAIEPWQVKELGRLSKRGFDRFKKGKLLG